jgi:DNA-binding CsgD family transcriptional regulator
MMVANSEGLLLFDGRKWTTVNNISPSCRDIAIDHNNKIWVCGDNYFGFLKAGASGEMEMEDLTHLIPEQDRNFGYAWTIHVLDNRIILQTTWFVFILDNGKIKAISSPTGYHGGLLFKNQFYVREKGIGMKILKGDSLELIPDGNKFADDRIYTILPYDDQTSLFVSMKKGLFKYDGTKFTPWLMPGYEHFINNTLTTGILLPNGNYVIGSGNDGLSVITHSGQIILHLDKSTGLNSNTVYDVYYNNSNGMLFASLQNGIASIELNSPFRILPVQDSWMTDISILSTFGDQIIFGGNPTIYSMPRKPCSLPLGKIPVTPVNFSNTLSFQVFESDGNLYNLSMTGAVYFDEKLRVHSLYTCDCETRMLVPSEEDPDKGLIYTANSFRKIDKVNKIWQVGEKIIGIPGALQLVEHSGSWFVLKKDSLIKFNLYNQGDSLIKVKKFTPPEVPALRDADIFRFKSNLFLVNDKGFYSYNPVSEIFEIFKPIDSLFNNRINTFGRPFGFQVLHNKIWFLYRQKGGGYLTENQGVFTLSDNDLLKLQAFNDRCELIYPVDSTLVLINLNKKGIVFYHPQEGNLKPCSFPARINRISFTNTNETLFAGFQSQENGPISFINYPVDKATIPYNKNSLQFELGALWFEDSELTEFQYYLDGFSTGWSDWSLADRIDFSALHEGHYTFHLKARNIYQVIGSEATFRFRILPPWYRTWWMISLFAAIFLSLAALSLRLYNRRLVKVNIKLETLVRNRTNELIQNKDALLQADFRLKELEKQRVEEELRYKNEELRQKHQEITNLALLIANHNEFTNRYINRIAAIYKSNLSNVKQKLVEVVLDMRRDINKDEHTLILRENLEKVDPHFFYSLKQLAPSLTQKEVQLVALIRSNLTIKEIASILNKSTKAIEMDRYRIRIKLGLQTNENIREFLAKLS